MKKQIYLRFILTLSVLFFFSFEVIAQNGTLQGNVIDEKTKESLPFACIVIEKDGKPIAGTAADIDGNYTIKPIQPGIYDLKATIVGYFKVEINKIEIKSDSISYQNFILSMNPNCFIEDLYISIDPSLLDKDPKPSGQTYTSEEINKMAW